MDKTAIIRWCKATYSYRRTKSTFVKCALLFLSSMLLCCYASAQAQAKVTFGADKEPLTEALNRLSKLTGINIGYPTTETQKAGAISLEKTTRTLDATLALLLKSTALDYKFLDGRIVIFKKHAIKKKPSPTGKTMHIEGQVVDENNNPLQGITVTINGTQRGTATDKNGGFLLEGVEREAIISFQGVGYLRQEQQAHENMPVMLNQQVSNLDEVQVIAYGTTTKRLNTGSVTTVHGKDIERQPISNPLAALEGRVPGLVVTQTTGVPGGAFKIELRGRTALDRSITDDQPLIIIDGVPVASNNGYLSQLNSSMGSSSATAIQPGGMTVMNNINPKDIERIEVLKDADATAIYGSRGANSVILITTRSGHQGKTTVNMNAYTGWGYVPDRIRMMNTIQYLETRKQAFTTEGTVMTNSNAYDLLIWDSTRYTDISRLFLGNTAKSNDVQVSISGGTAQTKFLLGGNFHNENAVFSNNLGEKKAGFHYNLSHQSVNKKFNINFSGSYTHTDHNLLSIDVASTLVLPPNIKIYEEDGSLAWNEGGINSGQFNPISHFEKKASTKTDYLTANLLLGYEIAKDLFIKTSLGFNKIDIDEKQRFPGTSQNPLSTINRYSYFANGNYEGWIAEPQLEYNAFLSKGKINFLLGTTFQANTQENENFTASGYSSDMMMDGLSGATNIIGTKSNSPYKYSAAFGRLNYKWDEKYLVNLTARRDGSSRFAPENRFANFGAIGGAWILSEEKWFDNLRYVISFFKIRGSYGLTGNDKISNYQFLDTWSVPVDGYEGASVLYPSKLYNAGYHWEKTIKKEIGLELSFLKDRISLIANYYNNSSSNQLISYRLSSIAGFTSIVRNFPAVVQNTGLEIALQSTNIRSSKLLWSTSLNLTIPRNRLKSFPGLANSSYASRYVEGEPLDLIYAYRFLGVDPQSGLFKVEDKNNDGIYNANDYQVSGYTTPEIYGGLQNTISYKGFEIDFLFSFRKQKGENYLSNISYLGGPQNLPAALYSRFWKQPGDEMPLQKLSPLTTGVTRTAISQLLASDGIYADASFVRLKNLSISYNLMKNLIKSKHFSGARIYLQAQNLLTFTSYEIGDPETQNWIRTPPLKVIVLGVQLSI